MSETRTSAKVRTAFVVAGVLNVVGMLLFTSAFTSDRLARVDPEAFSLTGTLLICAWGVAYIGASRVLDRARWLVGAFVLEKVVYASRWVWWISGEEADLGALFRDDPLTGLYYAIYGPYDFLWGAFFLMVFLRRGGRSAASR